MDKIIIFWIIITAVCLAITIIYIITSKNNDYKYHMKATRKNSNKYGYADFNIFKREFDNIEWVHQPEYKFSLFGKYHTITNQTEIHAGIISFNNVGMIMKTKKDYKNVCKFVKTYIKSKGWDKDEFAEETVKWD